MGSFGDVSVKSRLGFLVIWVVVFVESVSLSWTIAGHHVLSGAEKTRVRSTPLYGIQETITIATTFATCQALQ
jgi:hypothetical protein